MTAAKPSVTGKALWYIETRLHDEHLTLETIAQASSVSRFHLSRAFSLSTGYTLTGYLRARRLSEAAKVLAQGAPDILTVALAAGYNSHEAFTRAFRYFLGVTPEQFRDRSASPQRPLLEPLRMNPTASTPLTPPRLVTYPDDRPELLLFGLGQRFYKGGDAAIPALWNRFGPYIGALPGQIGKTTYGVIIGQEDQPGFDYICAVEVSAFPDARDLARAVPADVRDVAPARTNDVPDLVRSVPSQSSNTSEFRRLTLPPATYAVFEHREHISTIFATMKAIWEHGLSDAHFQPAPAPAFERYGDSFDANTGFGGFEIWIPVRA